MSPLVTIWSELDQRERILMKMNLAYPKAVKADTREVNERVNDYQDDLSENHQKNIHDNNSGVVANCESWLVHLFRGWFLYKLASPERRIKQKCSASRSHDGFLMDC